MAMMIEIFTHGMENRMPSSLLLNTFHQVEG